MTYDLSAYPTIRVGASDLNGQLRGKRVPGSYATKLAGGAVRMPYSALNVDIGGVDIEGSPLIFESGDKDGVLLPTERGPVPMPWLASPSALVPLWMSHEDGSPFAGDPRHALARVAERYAGHGWQVMAATEMEFTLVDDSEESLGHPMNPQTGRPIATGALLSVRQMDAFDAFFTDLYAGSEAMGIPAQAAISESGIGQFEINLNHQPLMRAADDAWLFKLLVRGIARKHGFAATFMAKPFEDDAGNGLHTHFSVIDAEGHNIFDDGGPHGTQTLRHAVAGCLTAMPGSTLVLAPHLNSFTRLVPGWHAPIAAVWGYDNRTTAIRIPGGPPAARRIEHRTAGGDINPYLMLAAVVGAALEGIEARIDPPAPVDGNAYEVGDVPQLAPDLASAIEAFANDATLARVFDPLLIDNLCRTKRQEIARFAEIPEHLHWQSYLESV
jgi:glutamine synthetase